MIPGASRMGNEAALPDVWLLDPVDRRQPSRGTVVVEPCVNPLRFNGYNIPPVARVKGRSDLSLFDRMRTGIGTLVAEAQHIEGSLGLCHRSQAGHVPRTLVLVERVKQSTVQYRFELAPQ